MKQEYINILTLKEYFLIMSTLTKKPYLDKNYGCYMFETRSDADAFTKEIQGTYYEEARTFKQIHFCTEFYSYGITSIHVQERGKEIIIVPVEKEDVRKQFYNADANKLIYRLKQTSEKQYLRKLNNVSFFAPVFIEKRLPKQHPSIHYCYATFTGNDVYYILFSTLQEFELWNKEQVRDWKPLEISLSKFSQIQKGKPVLINPIQDKLILTNQQIEISIGGNANDKF